MILIGLAGPARVGKDTAAEILAEEYGLFRYAFAEPLKRMLETVFGDHFREGDRSGICPETGKSYRYMLQTLGTELGREMWHPDVWVRATERMWKGVQAGEVYVSKKGQIGMPQAFGMVLSDVRFDSEAEWIRNQGGTVIHLRRDGVEFSSDHVSESGVKWEQGDALVSNNCDLPELARRLREVTNLGS